MVLPVTFLLMLLFKIDAYLSGVLRCRILPSDKSIMFGDEGIILAFQLYEPLLQLAPLGGFTVYKMVLDMLLDVLVGFFISVNGSSIFLAETLLCKC